MKTPYAGAVACALSCSLAVSLVHSQDAALDPRDFSKTNSVTLFLAEAERGSRLPGQGLEHIYWERDGRTTAMSVEGIPCRRLDLAEQGCPKGYFYFSIHPTFKSHDLAKVRIDVEYFDGLEAGIFGLQYDATGSGDGPGATSRPSYPNVPLKGSGKWLKASFHVTDGTFQNSQNGGADFRLWASPPELCVSRVTVTLEPVPESPPAKPLAFDTAGEAKLRGWNLQWDSGSKPSFSSSAADQAGPRWLEIRAPGTPAVGSWRTCALLEAGEYRFVGQVRTTGAEGDAGFAGGVGLRASGRTAAKRVSDAPAGTTLSCDFTMPALDYVELVCEFRSRQGSARFDLDSLKLIRKNKSRQ
jgi:hypothetical protein